MLLGDFQVSMHTAERAKFDAPLLFLHGLWTGPWIWSEFAAYLGHRGWSSYVVDLHSGAEDRHWAETLNALQRATASLDTAPVVIGHDAGALLALALRSTRAAVALAPPPIGAAARAHPILRGTRARLARWLGRPLLPSRTQAAALLGVPDSSRLVPEPIEWVEDLLRIETGSLGTGDVPRLVLAAGADACVSVDAVRRLASAVGADFVVQEEASRALPFGPAWEGVVSEVHRWIVRRLGEPLLLLRGDEDLRDE